METVVTAADARAVQARLEPLIAAHLDLVYSAALRQVRDPHLAEDITQNVFLIAAKKAAKVSPDRLAGWLIVVTRYVALLDTSRRSAAALT